MVKGLIKMKYLENEIYRRDIEKTILGMPGFEHFYGKRIWILGASGLIGSYMVDCFLLANQLRNAQIDITAVSRNRAHLSERFGSGKKYLHNMEADISTMDIPDEVDYIIHAASYSYPAAFRTAPVEVMLSNFAGTAQILDYTKNNPDCRVVYISSGEVYGNVDHMMSRACYPVSKMAAETLCVAYSQEYGSNAVIVRPCHTFGANTTVKDNHATVQFINQAVINEDIILHSAGSQKRSYAYVADCVSGILTAAACGISGEGYDIATDEVISIRGFAEKCAVYAGVQVKVNAAGETEKKELSPVADQIMSNEKLKALGWKPQFTIEEGIEHSIQIKSTTQFYTK